jgi:hypothetical protein
VRYAVSRLLGGKMNKRQFLKTAATASVAAFVSRSLFGQWKSPPKTFTYKTADGCDMKADPRDHPKTYRGFTLPVSKLTRFTPGSACKFTRVKIWELQRNAALISARK